MGFWARGSLGSSDHPKWYRNPTAELKPHISSPKHFRERELFTNANILPTRLRYKSRTMTTLSQSWWNAGVVFVLFMLHIHAWPDTAEIVFISEHSKTAVYTVTNIKSYTLRKHSLVQMDFVKGLSKRFICFKMRSFPEALLIKCYSFIFCKSIENQL